MDPTAEVQREHQRVRAHLEGAWREVGSAPTHDLSEQARLRRGRLLQHLRDYIDAGRYPINDVMLGPTPIFVDNRGARCAVAALLEATGESALVDHVARSHNLARVHELVAEKAFADWLAHHGLHAHEAARIQPAYHAHLDADWEPTASVIVGSQLSVTEEIGVEGIVAPGVRAGVRRNVSGSDDRGMSQYGSVALVAEYAREVVVPRGGTHRLALMFQWEPIGNSRDAQWYLIGGPVASVDTGDHPGSGFGGQLAAGFSFRRREVPLLVELTTQTLGQAGYLTARLGVQVGAVW